MSDTANKNQLLEILQQNNIIDAKQVASAKRRMERSKITADKALVELDYCSQTDIYQALSQLHGIPFVELHKIQISEEARKSVPTKAAIHYRFVPLKLNRDTLEAAFSTPPKTSDLERLRLLIGKRIIPNLATANEISNSLKSIYGLGAETLIKIQETSKTEYKARDIQYNTSSGTLDEEDENAPITSLVNQILIDALEMGATDVHIEPYHDSVKLRYRVDGMLQEIPVPQGVRRFHEAIISRLKVMADLNIAEKRLPHDGRIRVNIGEEGFDLRVSIIPTRFGETMCLRILNRKAIFLGLPDLGLEEHDLRIFERLVNLPHGIVLVTGPTGSGKTTTLYAALARVIEISKERKVITIEDPVEYEMAGISQIQIHSDIGLTFASGLRSILRHDPDIVLVGEIRDAETAEIAIRASLTGHLVFSTLHTNDSVSSVNRLIDMGVESYLAASSLVACLAQRLVRKICKYCKVEDENISPHIRAEIADVMQIEPGEVEAWKGAGCPECNHSGYNGRVAIYEIFLVDEKVQDMISDHDSTSNLRRSAREAGMKTLREDGWIKVAKGRTTIEEVSRITGNFLIDYNMVD